MAESEAAATITARAVYVDPSKILYPREVVPTPAPPAPIVPEPTPFAPVPEVPGKRRLIVNIETTGYRPWEHRIISIGLQNPMVPNELPVVIMHPDEKFMITSFLTVIREMDFNELIGYGLSFDYRFLLIKAMKYNIDCKEFYDCDLYDLMQAAAQGKFEFMYKPQSPPKLSDLADYLWGYPKPFTDLEMIKFYAQGQLDKVIEFTSSQITRILALYLLFRRVSENPFIAVPFGSVNPSSIAPSSVPSATESKLTIPEAHLPELARLRCPNCMSEKDFPLRTQTAPCNICDGVMKTI